jgi:ATP-dependent Clp protease ATP-binding subunit ClpA
MDGWSKFQGAKTAPSLFSTRSRRRRWGILFVDELNSTMTGSDSLSGGTGSANILKPMLAHGKLIHRSYIRVSHVRCNLQFLITDITSSEIRKCIEKDAVFER